MYGSGSLEPETDFRELHHPLFDKYKVDLALQGHLHVYERIDPITFNDDDDDEPKYKITIRTISLRIQRTNFCNCWNRWRSRDTISSLDDYAGKGIDGKFGILDIELESDQTH